MATLAAADALSVGPVHLLSPLPPRGVRAATARVERMVADGHTPDEIAAAIRMPVAWVHLVLKLINRGAFCLPAWS